MKETDIQRAICDYFALKKYFFYRNNNVPVYDPVGQKFRAMPKYTMRGIPDIVLIKDSKYIGIEVKRPKTKLSEHQKAFQKALEKAGGIYIIARSVDDVAHL